MIPPSPSPPSAGDGAEYGICKHILKYSSPRANRRRWCPPSHHLLPLGMVRNMVYASIFSNIRARGRIEARRHHVHLCPPPVAFLTICCYVSGKWFSPIKWLPATAIHLSCNRTRSWPLNAPPKISRERGSKQSFPEIAKACSIAFHGILSCVANSHPTELSEKTLDAYLKFWIQLKFQWKNL